MNIRILSVCPCAAFLALLFCDFGICVCVCVCSCASMISESRKGANC